MSDAVPIPSVFMVKELAADADTDSLLDMLTRFVEVEPTGKEPRTVGVLDVVGVSVKVSELFGDVAEQLTPLIENAAAVGKIRPESGRLEDRDSFLHGVGNLLMEVAELNKEFNVQMAEIIPYENPQKTAARLGMPRQDLPYRPSSFKGIEELIDRLCGDEPDAILGVLKNLRSTIDPDAMVHTMVNEQGEVSSLLEEVNRLGRTSHEMVRFIERPLTTPVDLQRFRTLAEHNIRSAVGMLFTDSHQWMQAITEEYPFV